jgi:hypothetical protein
MADTGAVANDALYEIRVILSQSAAAVYNIAVRDTANSADVSPFPMALYGAAGQSSQYALLVTLAKNQRVRVTMGASLTGLSQVFIQAEAML